MAMASKMIALHLDERDDPINATNAYERAIRESGADAECFQNLAALYFTCLDPGYAAAHRLLDSFCERAFDRISALPGEAMRTLGQCDEVCFWAGYTRYFVVGEPPDERTWRTYVETHTTLVPLVYFVDEVKGGRYASENRQLLQDVAATASARARYVSSMLKPRKPPLSR